MITLKKRIKNYSAIMLDSRSQWPRGLRRRPAAARLLILWVRIPPGAWIFVCCECYQVEVSATD